MSKHSHNQDHEKGHGHTHGMIDPSLATSQKGLWAVKWSSIVLFLGALAQLIVVFFSGSVALLTDTIHNFGDAATAIPLAIAFLLGRRKPNERFTYGYGKVEDIAGIIILLFMFTSAIVALYVSIERIFNPQEVTHLWIVIAAALIGFAVNEGAAIFRIRVGKLIKSQALIADGYHARTDGWTSLAVLFGAIGIALGFPLADPLIGILIAIMILKTTWDSSKEVFTRALDGVDPEITKEIHHAVSHTKGVEKISDTRVRWIGHTLHAEINLAVNPKLSVEQAHEIAKEAERNLKSHIPHLTHTMIHIDPLHSAGEQYHALHKQK